MVQNDRKELQKNSKFCMAPWVHAEIHHNSQVYPCCRIVQKMNYGSLKTAPLNEIWNSPSAQNFRTKFLSGEGSEFCHDCYDREREDQVSTRQAMNHYFMKYFDRVEKTSDEGFSEFKNLPSLDIRFSNICNFRCRICDADSSTSWYADHNSIYPDTRKGIVRPTLNRADLWRELDSLIPHIERVYFAGGEPLLDEDHYIFLEKLIAAGKTDILLSYNSNFSTLKLGSKHIFSYWKKFSKIDMAVSLDGSGEPLEVMRKGARWKDVLSHIKQTRVMLPQVQISFMPTISALNIYHIADAFCDWAREGLLTESSIITSNILYYPSYLSVNILSPTEKKSVELHFAKTLSEFKSKYPNGLYNVVAKQLSFILASLGSEFYADLRPVFQETTLKLDRLRGENLSGILAHVAELK